MDWRALSARLRRASERGLVDSLRTLDAIRREAETVRHTYESVPRIVAAVRIVAMLGAIQTVYGLGRVGAAVANGEAAGGRLVQVVLALSFAAASVILSSARSPDPRRLFLLATFICAASTFTRAAMSAIVDGWPGVTHAVYGGISLEAFIPACVWGFALDFPRVHRFTWFDRAARHAARLTWLVGTAVVVLNVGAAHGIVTEPALLSLLPSSPTNFFWHVFTASVLPALAAIFIRSRRAPPGERTRVWRFAVALVVSLAPFVLLGLARAALPGFDHWFRAAASSRSWIDLLVVAGLVATPLSSSLAVILDRPFDLDGLGLARWRAQPSRLIRFLLRGGALESSSYHERLARAVEGVSRARGARETSVVLERELRASLEGAAAWILTETSDGRFADSAVALAPLSSDAALLAMVREADAPIDASPRRPLFDLLPPADREWLVANTVDLIAPIRDRQGTLLAIAAIGRRTVDSAWNDHLLVTALTAAASIAWTAGGVEDAGGDRPAYECNRCGLVDDGPIPSCSCGAPTALASVPRDLARRFVIERRLGSGGMGVVYLAADLTIGRPVALKTLPSLRRGLGQLRGEARTMGALNHEGLATIYGVEMWRDTPIMAIEYFAAGTLARRLESGPLPVADALTIARALAGALEYMHGRGVLHRDLKPSNIGLTETGAPKLLDFGLASLIGAANDASGHSAASRNAAIAGTTAYLPPEAFDFARATPSFDLWALAVVLLESIVGVNPLAAPDRATTIDRVRQLDLSDAFTHAERLHPGLGPFFAKALDRRRDRRFATASGLRAGLPVK